MPRYHYTVSTGSAVLKRHSWSAVSLILKKEGIVLKCLPHALRKAKTGIFVRASVTIKRHNLNKTPQDHSKIKLL